MRTAEEMYQHCIDNGYTHKRIREEHARESFEVIEKNLPNNEKVFEAFSSGIHGYVITENHLLISKKNDSQESFKVFSLDDVTAVELTDTILSYKMLWFRIPPGLGGSESTALPNAVADNVFPKLNEILSVLRAKRMTLKVAQTASGGGTVADELIKWKQLLDSGLLTLAEFEEQKQKVLTNS